jgi:molybdate transport system ATP-binding protein
MGKLSLDVTLARAGFELAVKHEIALGGITAVYGPSASGKTTLLRVIAGLEEDARGLVAFDDTVWQRGDQRVPAHKRGVGYVFQDGRLFAHLTADGAPARTDFGAVVSELDLAALLPRRPASLSGGEQQRVAIGRALLTSPRLLLMDEPLSSLDVGRKREIVPLIERLPRTFGVPVLYVTHNVDEVARLAADMLLLKAGRIVASGRVADVLERLDIDDLDAAEPPRCG